VVASDGGGTELRNNWVHDNQAAGARLGIYLDNFTSNYVIHHNVCWDTGKGAIRLNKPSLYNVVAHNTVLGSMNTWGRWPEDWMYGCVYASNLLTAAIQRHPQLALAGNVEKVPAESLTPENFAKISAGADKGVAVPGITGAYLGTAPDAGAYEHGAPPWNAGHDFADPPKPVWRLAANPFRNRIRHGSFDWDLYRGELGPWRQTHGAKAEIIAGKGGIAKSYATRNTIIRCGLRLQGDGPDGIEQTVQDLEPNSTFDLTGWVKTQRHTEVRLGILFPDGKQVFKTVASEQWTQARVRFETSATITSAVVYATKSGPGAAYADDLALVAVLPAFAPGNPGPLP